MNNLNNIIEKNKVYQYDFISDDYFWGFGIELESYIEIIKDNKFNLEYVLKNMRRERYSIDYNLNYKVKPEPKILNKQVNIPMYLNAYSFLNTDLNKEHRTTYEKFPKPNKKFSDQSIIDYLGTRNNFFIDEKGYGKTFIFDGDTIEFVNRYFYKVSLKDVIKEIKTYMNSFINNLNNTLINESLKVRISDVNYGFVNYWSNPKNINVFNNGTYHINITYPTRLDKNAEILDINLFNSIHIKIMKVLQWISPLIMANYGSPDIYTMFKDINNDYSYGSLRLSISRYIGIGTYDTDNIVTGKVLQENINDNKSIKLDYYWLNKLINKTNYKLSDMIGLDFNYMKHINHGIEWRILDSFPIKYMSELIIFICNVIDYSLILDIPNPIHNKCWNKLTYKCIKYGWSYNPKKYIIREFEMIFKLNLYDEYKSLDIKNMYEFIKLFNKKIYEKLLNINDIKLIDNLIGSLQLPKLKCWNKKIWEKQYIYYNFDIPKYDSDIVKFNNFDYRILFLMKKLKMITILKQKKQNIYLNNNFKEVY